MYNRTFSPALCRLLLVPEQTREQEQKTAKVDDIFYSGTLFYPIAIGFWSRKRRLLWLFPILAVFYSGTLFYPIAIGCWSRQGCQSRNRRLLRHPRLLQHQSRRLLQRRRLLQKVEFSLPENRYDYTLPYNLAWSNGHHLRLPFRRLSVRTLSSSFYSLSTKPVRNH